MRRWRRGKGLRDAEECPQLKFKLTLLRSSRFAGQSFEGPLRGKGVEDREEERGGG